MRIQSGNNNEVGGCGHEWYYWEAGSEVAGGGARAGPHVRVAGERTTMYNVG